MFSLILYDIQIASENIIFCRVLCRKSRAKCIFDKIWMNMKHMFINFFRNKYYMYFAKHVIKIIVAMLHIL